MQQCKPWAASVIEVSASGSDAVRSSLQSPRNYASWTSMRPHHGPVVKQARSGQSGQAGVHHVYCTCPDWRMGSQAEPDQQVGPCGSQGRRPRGARLGVNPQGWPPPRSPDGWFQFRTVRPGRTRLPDDGPVGRLPTKLGLGLDRPAHLHFRVTAPGFDALVNHVFDRDDPLVGPDLLFGGKPELLAPFGAALEDEGSPCFHLDVTFTLCRAGAAAGVPP